MSRKLRRRHFAEDILCSKQLVASLEEINSVKPIDLSFSPWKSDKKPDTSAQLKKCAEMTENMGGVVMPKCPRTIFHNNVRVRPRPSVYSVYNKLNF